jgi:lipase chaperone LimK
MQTEQVVNDARRALKARLGAYRTLKAEQKQIERLLGRLRDTMGAPTGSRLDGMPRGGGVGDPVGRQVEQLNDLETRYETQRDRLIAAQADIEATIEDLESTERQLMRLRYIDGLKWEEICVKLGYEWSQTHRIHNRSLDKILAKEG